MEKGNGGSLSTCNASSLFSRWCNEDDDGNSGFNDNDDYDNDDEDDVDGNDDNDIKRTTKPSSSL